MPALTGGSYTIDTSGDLKLVERTLDPVEAPIADPTMQAPADVPTPPPPAPAITPLAKAKTDTSEA